jgi:hypothetical protein
VAVSRLREPPRRMKPRTRREPSHDHQGHTSRVADGWACSHIDRHRSRAKAFPRGVPPATGDGTSRSLGVGPELRRTAVVILEVLAGVWTSSAATALGIRLPRYYVLEERAIGGLIPACAPRPKGRTVSTDRRLDQLDRVLAATQRELARQQALARPTQRAFIGIGGSLAAPPLPHHRAYGAVPRRFDRIKRSTILPDEEGRSSRNRR